MKEANRQKVEQFELFVCMVNECIENERPLAIAIEHDNGSCHCWFTIVPDLLSTNGGSGIYLEGEGNILQISKVNNIFYNEEEDEFILEQDEVTYMFASTSPCAL